MYSNASFTCPALASKSTIQPKCSILGLILYSSLILLKYSKPSFTIPQWLQAYKIPTNVISHGNNPSFESITLKSSIASFPKPLTAKPTINEVQETLFLSTISSKTILASSTLPHLAYKSNRTLLECKFRVKPTLIIYTWTLLPNVKAPILAQADNKLTIVNPSGLIPLESISVYSAKASSGLPFSTKPLITEFQATRSFSGILSNTL
ncbi:hypothetical protein CARUB_v10005741mg [Capsella rubella]|uniref:Uncharacterized protein n=1 Tax=Capsella rubella TaxID=81985 RepID=R0GW13_9BRAS|nr:hypothetical protein CARUB_v10005741mg [Capsella rubella]